MHYIVCLLFELGMLNSGLCPQRSKGDLSIFLLPVFDWGTITEVMAVCNSITLSMKCFRRFSASFVFVFCTNVRHSMKVVCSVVYEVEKCSPITVSQIIKLWVTSMQSTCDDDDDEDYEDDTKIDTTIKRTQQPSMPDENVMDE